MAFKAYRYVNAQGGTYLRYPITCHVDPVATALERQAYVGGRTEVFRCAVPVALPCYKLDINSLYPSVMASNLFPTRLLEVREGDPFALRTVVEQGGLVVAEVEVVLSGGGEDVFVDRLVVRDAEHLTALFGPWFAEA